MTNRDPEAHLSNRLARRIFLQRQGLCAAPRSKQSKQDLLGQIRDLGFVQVDSVNTVERAHHMILFTRNQTYKRETLKTLLERDRDLFENWTHDAAIIPTEFHCVWRHRFEREKVLLQQRWEKWRRPGFKELLVEIEDHIRENGPVMARALASDQKKAGSGWWDWHPSKTALEYLWRTGVLAVSRRQAFQKVYDLTENVVPEHYRADAIDESTLVDWCCRGALQRLGVATAGEIAAFWGAISLTEVQQWIADVAGTEFPVVTVGLADGTSSRPMLADPDVLSAHEDDVAPPGRLRVVSPFDPVIRDRKRALRLFGFDYRIEIFVPASKRKYGYYVFPILEGDRFVGRIDMRCDRVCETLVVTNVWWEPGLRPSRQRQKQLDAELQRVAAFAGCSAIEVNRSLAAS